MPLGPAAPLDQRWRALVVTMRDWFIARARDSGGDVWQEDGLTWTNPARPGATGTVAFPRLQPARAGTQLDAILERLRVRPPERGVGCWSARPDPDIGVRLAARGFRWGWRPHWMWLELASLPEDPPRPPGLEIALADDDGPFGVEGLPYDDPAELPALHAAARRRPRRFWRFAARLDGRVVGQSALHLTTGHLGIAGIFSVGVVPAARRQGIGSAVTLAACRQAQALGCHHAALNATPDGERLYRRLGFTSLGHGQTWWLDAPVLAAPSGADQVAFAEAIGWGDVAALAALASRLPSAAAQTPLANGMLPLDLAVTTRQPAAAEWLVSHGATLDLLSAWDLGWKERLPALLAADPALVGHRSGEASATPLHLAAQRGDLELARLLLAAGADLEARDSSYQSTPLGWAEYLGQQGIAALLRQHRNGEQP